MQKRTVHVYSLPVSKVAFSLHPAVVSPYEFLTKLEFSTPLTTWPFSINEAITSLSSISARKISAKEFQIIGGLLAYRFHELQRSHDRQIEILVDKKWDDISSVELNYLAWLEILSLLRFQLHTKNNRVLYQELMLGGLLPEKLQSLLLAGDPEHLNHKMNINRLSDLLGIDRNCFARAQKTQNQRKQSLTDLNVDKSK